MKHFKEYALIALSSTLLAVAPSHANANGDAVAGKTKAALCAGCHGAGGNSVVPIFPKLAGQHAQYLEQSMKEFRSKTRTGANAAQMYPMVASLSDQDIADLAAYFASN